MDAKFAARAAITSILALGAIAYSETPATETKEAVASQALPADSGWPREYKDESGTLLIYQPQIDSWESFRRIEARFAVALTPSTNKQPVYGAIRTLSDTLVDTESRTVAFTNFTIADTRFPAAAKESEAESLKALTAKLFPTLPTSISLDRVLAYMDASQARPRQTAISLDPPPILVSTQPAVLVIIDGEPVLFDIEKTELQKVVNTNWDLFFHKDNERYYLRKDKTWLSAKKLTDAWKSEKKLPKDFSRLPDTDEYQEIKQTAKAPQKMSPVVLVLVVHKPTELIVINGKPSLEAVPDTGLSWVTNTECDLFFARVDGRYYLLTSGRWFRTPDLHGGKWEPATSTLPDDFKKIPLNHPRAHVLASVPGTRQAEEAVLMASIPQTATIDRKTAQAQVQYVGEPKFEEIKGTSISYATNTPNDVLRVGDSYYLCLDGVWFLASSASGPWTPADKVPPEVYAIPAESPKHNVTYVTIQESTPETVVYSYTPGYTGMYVGFGVAVWGTGYYYPPYYGWGYYPYPVYWPYPYYTYGASAWYNPVTGAYARGSAVYGPYGGYGRAAAYNPSTGRYSWGRTAWGPYGAAASGGFYNPRTGTWGGRYAASNGYQSWGQSVVARGDRWARTASYSDSRGTVAGIKTSEGGRAIAARGNEGQGFAARSAAGDVYAGRDGNVYRRDQSGQWSKNNGGSWESIQGPSRGEGTREQVRNSAQGRTGAAGSSGQVGGLERDAAARNWGNYSSQRSSSARSTGSYSRSSARYGGFSGRGGRRR
jgi:hypothetical protein